MMDFTTLKNKKILITGNTGFKGSWLTLLLLRQGAKLYGISKSIPTIPSLFELAGLKKNIHQITADVCDPSIVQQIEAIQPDIIFHLAAQSITRKGITDPRFTIENNISATLSILEYLRKSQDNCTALFITSDKCYLNQEWVWGYRETDVIGGKEPYGASKAICELVYASYFQTYYKHMSNIKTATVRAGNVIGGGDFSPDRVIPDCVRAWSMGNAVGIRNKNAVRPWLHVIEPLVGYMQLCCELMADDKFDGESFNFGPPNNAFHVVSDVVQELASHFSFGLPEPLYEELKVEQSHEATLLRISSDKAESCLGWKPKLSFEESIKLTAKWYDTFILNPEKIRTIMDEQIENYVIN